MNIIYVYHYIMYLIYYSISYWVLILKKLLYYVLNYLIFYFSLLTFVDTMQNIHRITFKPPNNCITFNLKSIAQYG